MYKRTTTTIILAITMALLVFPAQAQVKTDALLIGTSQTSDTLTDLRAILNTNFDINNVQVVTAGSANDIAEHVRSFLTAPGKPDQLRIIWVEGGTDVCPSFDEIPVRPQVRSLIIAPSCIKLLVQAPTTYERLNEKGQDNRSVGDHQVPAVAFVSLTDKTAPKPSDILPKGSETLAQTLTCSQRGQIILDFSPSMAAWDVFPTDCQAAEQVVMALPPAHPVNEALPVDTIHNKAPELELSKDFTSSPIAAPAAVMGNKLMFASPVKGRVVSAYGSNDGGKPNKGIDIEVPIGTVAKAAESGEVVFVGVLLSYGQVVAIKHDNDWATVYAHTVNSQVVLGQKVAKGEYLAEVDPAKNRLHFEIRRKGKPMDPEPLMTNG